jgi:hypothetical protein
MDTAFVIAANNEDFKTGNCSLAKLEEMAAAGCTAQQLIDFIKSGLATERLLDHRAKNRERQRRYRERNARNVSNVTLTPPEEIHQQNQQSCNVTVTLPENRGSSSYRLPIVSKPIDMEVTYMELPYGNSFEVFWSKYPHRVGKKAAAKAFASAIKRTSLEQMLAGIDRYVATKPSDRPWCNPSTWLNQDRWEDQPADDQIVAKQQALSPRLQVILNNRRMFDEAARNAYTDRFGPETPELLPLGRPTPKIISTNGNAIHSGIRQRDE